MNGRNGPKVILVIFTTATKIKNKTNARSNKRYELKGVYINVIEENLFINIGANIKGDWTGANEDLNKIKRKAIKDKGNINERPKGWLGVKAEK